LSTARVGPRAAREPPREKHKHPPLWRETRAISLAAPRAFARLHELPPEFGAPAPRRARRHDRLAAAPSWSAIRGARCWSPLYDDHKPNARSAARIPSAGRPAAKGDHPVPGAAARRKVNLDSARKKEDIRLRKHLRSSGRGDMS
jgi:hypothetical protein